MQPYDTRAGHLAAALDDFIRSSPDVEAAAVVSFDGLPMASAVPESMEEDRLAAMSAALLSLGEQAAMGLGRGQLNQVFVEGDHGFVFLMSAKDEAVLAAVAGRQAKIGFMLFEMRRAAARVGDVLAGPAPASMSGPQTAPSGGAASPPGSSAPAASRPDQASGAASAPGASAAAASAPAASASGATASAPAASAPAASAAAGSASAGSASAGSAPVGAAPAAAPSAVPVTAARAPAPAAAPARPGGPTLDLVRDHVPDDGHWPAPGVADAAR